jgi:hypothetical protein
MHTSPELERAQSGGALQIRYGAARARENACTGC